MKLLSTKEAAEQLGIDESRVRRLIAAGKLPAIRIGLRAHAINEDDLALVAERKPGRPKKADGAEALEIPAPPPHPPFPKGRPKKTETKPAKTHQTKAKGRK